jgi:hypothetical protein
VGLLSQSVLPAPPRIPGKSTAASLGVWTKVRESDPCLYGAKIQWQLRIVQQEETHMRHIIAAIVVVAGASLFATVGASAAPVNGKAIAQITGQSDQVIKVEGGCGRWHHRNRWGHCVHD